MAAKFKITTLSDIFNLPTAEQMKTCLKEITEGMISARLVNDMGVAAVRAAGGRIESAMEWPDSITWKDDGKGDVTTRYAAPDGKELFTLKTKVTAP